MAKTLKGETFQNRYRITGTLITASPLHIGTGEGSIGVYSTQEQARLREELGKVPEVSTVIKDHQGKPMIPGSSLRGVIRHWLLNILSGFGSEWAADRNYEDPNLTNLSQAEQIAAVKQTFSWLELLFGTPFHEGKVEVWDAICQTQSLQAPDSLLGWNPNSMTYIDTSVAINPITGTAIENLLYKTEVVPPGVKFTLDIAGQNLSDIEIGMLLLALQGFNSRIYPLRVGAHVGRGFGKMKYIPGPIYGLKDSDLPAWISSTINSFGTGRAGEVQNNESEAAGYFALPKLSVVDQQQLINKAKTELTGQMRS